MVTLLALRAERPDRTQLLGLALGFLGVCVVLAPWQLIGHGGPCSHNSPAWQQL
ncbi:hypothetical protein L831_4920 [Mycobacteroides abscessus MAB_082312_2272]|nr:hypothetical protein L831_4920 [Mycobacteroides abscessus MAB_082312_2272]